MRLLPAILLLTLPCVYAQITTVHQNGMPIGREQSLNFLPNSGTVPACADNPSQNRIDCSFAFNTAVIAAHDQIHANENFCESTNGTALYTCKLPFRALGRYSAGMTLLLRADATCATTCQLNVDGLGPITIRQSDGVTSPNGAIVAGQPYWIFFDGTIFRLASSAGSSTGSGTSASAPQADQRGDIRGRRLIGAMDTMPYAAAIALEVTAGDLHKTTTANTAGNATINASTGGLPGQHMWIVISNDQISAKTISFGSNLRSTGALTGAPGKSATIQFVSDGTVWYEVGRTQGL
jgi:hypothetical protein